MAMTWKTLSRFPGRALSLTRARWQSTTATVISKDDTESKDKELQETIIGVPLSKSSYNAGLLNALSLDNASAPERRKVRKQDIINKFRREESDTGSPEVQSTYPVFLAHFRLVRCKSARNYLHVLVSLYRF